MTSLPLAVNSCGTSKKRGDSFVVMQPRETHHFWVTLVSRLFELFPGALSEYVPPEFHVYKSYIWNREQSNLSKAFVDVPRDTLLIRPVKQSSYSHDFSVERQCLSPCRQNTVRIFISSSSSCRILHVHVIYCKEPSP